MFQMILGNSRFRAQSEASALLSVSSSAQSTFVLEVVKNMQQDDVSMVCREDRLIIEYGQRLYNKHGHMKHEQVSGTNRYQYIRQKMRELGRFFLSITQIDPSFRTLSDSFVPQNFPVLVQAARSTAGYVQSTNTYKAPSVALKIGYSRKKCARIKKAPALQAEDKKVIGQCNRLIKLINSDWGNRVSQRALDTLRERKFNKPLLLLLAQDLVLVSHHVDTRLNELKSQLVVSVTTQLWSEFPKVILCKVVLFNRRRGGEAERMTMVAYDKVCIGDQEIIESLSPLERKLVSALWRVEIRGKKGVEFPCYSPGV